MFINPDLATQLALQHQRQMIEQASQQQRLQCGGIAPSAPGVTAAPAPAGRLRRLAATVLTLPARSRAAVAGASRRSAPGVARRAGGAMERDESPRTRSG
jgi:hypothetical protein